MTSTPYTPALQRLRDWPERWDALVRASTPMPFLWGVHDCCTFAADSVLALTGADPMRRLRGVYGGALSAAELLEQLGGLSAAVSDALGSPLPPALAGVGDVLLVRNEGRDILAVCNGTTALAPGPRGLAVLAAPQVLAAWGVGRGEMDHG